MLRERPELTSGRRAIWWRERAPADHGRRPVSIWLPYRRARRGHLCAGSARARGWPPHARRQGWRLLPGFALGGGYLGHAPAPGDAAAAPLGRPPVLAHVPGATQTAAALRARPASPVHERGAERSPWGLGAAVLGDRMSRGVVVIRCRAAAIGHAWAHRHALAMPPTRFGTRPRTLGRRARRRARPPWRLPRTLPHERPDQR